MPKVKDDAVVRCKTCRSTSVVRGLLRVVGQTFRGTLPAYSFGHCACDRAQNRALVFSINDSNYLNDNCAEVVPENST